MINIDTINLARILWEYQNLGQGLKKSDCIIVLGSHDLRVADWTAELFHKKWSELIIFSGGLGNFCAIDLIK